jgi:hypothetical protein
MFAVTQEDFVHPMAVIELLWKSCCSDSAGKEETEGGHLMMCLNVRQWIQILLDRSLLLGSLAKGVHLHDIVLEHVRSKHSASELQGLHTKVVDGLFAASRQRRAESGRGLQDTGNTPQALKGEELDWYACNIGRFHIKHSMDALVPLVESENVKQWLLLTDQVMFEQVVSAVGLEGLEALYEHNREQEGMLFETARVKFAVACSIGGIGTEALVSMKEALAVVEQSGITTEDALQLELDILNRYRRAFRTGTEEKKKIMARMNELSKHPGLLTDSWALILGNYLPSFLVLTGTIAQGWQNGRSANDQTILKGVGLWIGKAPPLMAKATSTAVGARKEAYAMMALLWPAWVYPSSQNLDEGVKLVQATTDRIWGRDGSLLMEAVKGFSFERHFDISQMVAVNVNEFLCYYRPTDIAEKTGDLEKLVDSVSCKQKYDLAYARSDHATDASTGNASGPLASNCGWVGMELQKFAPSFGNNTIRWFQAYEITTPPEAMEWFATAMFGYTQPQQWSSSDGLHHMFHPDSIHNHHTSVLVLAAADTSAFDMSYLDSLPPPDSPTLRCINGDARFSATARPLLAEVFEGDGRHADAIAFAQAELQSIFSVNLPSKVRAGRVLGRCHAVMGQHTLSVAAFDAAIDLAKSKRFLLSEALSVRGRVLAAKGSGEGHGCHWDDRMQKQQLEEVMGRMQGPRELLEKLMRGA